MKSINKFETTAKAIRRIIPLFSFIAGASLLLSACTSYTTKHAFSDQVIRDAGLKESDLFKVQFYLDRDIVLYRTLSNSDGDIRDGSITIRGGQQVEEILLRAGTKGVVVFMPEPDRLGVCFDPYNDEKYLMFGPNPKQNNRYTLLGSEWDGRQGKVTYGGEKWFTPSASAYATLLVDVKSRKNVSVHSESPAGRSL